MIPGFKIRGQALGNQFKFGSIIKHINYQQNRDDKTIRQANSRTREKFGESTKEGYSGDQRRHNSHYGINPYGYSESGQNSKL